MVKIDGLKEGVCAVYLLDGAGVVRLLLDARPGAGCVYSYHCGLYMRLCDDGAGNTYMRRIRPAACSDSAGVCPYCGMGVSSDDVYAGRCGRCGCGVAYRDGRLWVTGWTPEAVPLPVEDAFVRVSLFCGGADDLGGGSDDNPCRIGTVCVRAGDAPGAGRTCRIGGTLYKWAASMANGDVCLEECGDDAGDVREPDVYRMP